MSHSSSVIAGIRKALDERHALELLQKGGLVPLEAVRTLDRAGLELDPTLLFALEPLLRRAR